MVGLNNEYEFIVPAHLAPEAELLAEALNDRFELRRILLPDWLYRWAWLAGSAAELPRLVDDPADAYMKGLFARVWLAEAMESASPELSDWIAEGVTAPDATFQSNTVPDREELLWVEVEEPSWWWYRRIPVSDDLASRIRNLSEARQKESAMRLVQSASTVLESGEQVEVHQIGEDLWVRVGAASGRRFAWLRAQESDRFMGRFRELLDAIRDMAQPGPPFLVEPLSVEGWDFWRGIPAPIRPFASSPMRKSRLPAAVSVEELTRTFRPR